MATKATNELVIHQLGRKIMTVTIIGTTPLIMNSMSAKAQRSLLLGGQRKTAAEKAAVKHHPTQEFRSSIYKYSDAEGDDTRVYMPGGAIKAAMCTAALETAGATKTGIKRLVAVPAERVDIYGVPELRCDVVRSADINKTPDIRTRAIFPQWCATFDVAWIEPNLHEGSVLNLIWNAGQLVGIGDFRSEKGAGTFGAFEVVMDDDPRVRDLMQNAGRKAQDAAIASPSIHNAETQELFDMYVDEMARRHGDAQAAAMMAAE